MKQEIPQGAIIGAVVATVLLLGFFFWRSMRPAATPVGAPPYSAGSPYADAGASSAPHGGAPQATPPVVSQ